MRFGRNIFILLLLVALLTTALVITRRLHPVPAMLPGDALFPIPTDTITSLTWDVRNNLDNWQPLTLERKGNFWYMKTMYPGFRCDAAQMATVLDCIQAFKVAALLTPEGPLNFLRERQFVVGTPERQIVCDFGEVPKMDVAQMLASYNNKLITVDTGIVKQLPTTVQQLWCNAILPIPASHLTSIEWRAPQQPFTKAIKRETGAWSITQPFAFDPNEAEVDEALRQLTAPKVITAYIRPAASESAPPLLPETTLATYGLDEESAIRVTLRAKGFSEAVQLRFGSPDPDHPGHVYCLIDGRAAVVSVPEKLRAIFTKEGPFATNHLNMPVLGDVTHPVSFTVRGKLKGELTTLNLREGQWELTTPAALPADPVAVNTLLQQLLSLTGDLVDIHTLSEDSYLCTLFFTPSEQSTPIEVKLYHNAETQRLLIHRIDTNRFYTASAQAIPRVLYTLNILPQTLLNRTIFALPETTIRRIMVERDQATISIVAWNASTQTWNTEFPRGYYSDAAVITAWLSTFTNLKAETILTSAPLGEDLQATYNFTTPYLKITLDLDGGSEGLRKVLLIAKPHSNTADIIAMVQGRPMVYVLPAETFKLLETPLTPNAP